MDTNIQPSNSIYNIQQNDYGNNSFPQATNQYQNQNYSYQPAEDISYLPQNQAMINNQYPPQNQQIIQQTQQPQYNNLPLKKLSIDTQNMAKTAALNSAPPQINTSAGLNSGSPYYIPSPRRRRGDHTNYESTIRSFFGRTKQHHTVYDINHQKSYAVIIDPKVDRGFFVADNNWTCYRRNYFQISTVFSCFDMNTNEQIQLPCLVEVDDKVLKVNSFSIGISSRVSSGDKKIDIIQHTPKRDKGPQVIPKPKIIKAGGNHSQFASIGNEQSMVTFERLQFKTATANNGKRRAAQQYYILVLDLLANTEDGEIKVATIESDHLVVRGRSPGHYNDISLNTAIPQTVNMTSSASAAEGRFNRYPLTPTYGQYNNSPMILSPHSPASPGMPFHTGSQTPIQTPHSLLRQPPMNYNSPQPMSGISSNPGTPTNAGTPINMAVTTAGGMPMNNGYDENNQFYGQNQNNNNNPLPNQNQNQNYDNSQSSSLYINQTQNAQPNNVNNMNNQQNYIPQTQGPIQNQGNQQQNQQQQNNFYQNDYQNQQQQQPTNPNQVYENGSFYPVNSQQQTQTNDPYMNNQPNNSNSNPNYQQQTQSSYQGTPNQPPQNVFMTQQQATSLAQAPQTTQSQYVNQPYSQSVTQPSQYTIQNSTQEYNQPQQQGTPQQAYLTQPTTQAYLTPPQATTQQTPPQPSNYINGLPNQSQSTFMDSPQPKIPSLDNNNQIGKDTVDYLNSPSSNKNDIIDPAKNPVETNQYIDANGPLSKDPKNWLNNGNPPSIASTQHNEISSLTSK